MIAETFDVRKAERDALAVRASLVTERVIKSIASRYDRGRDLPALAPRLVGLPDAEIIAGLERSLQAEIRRSQIGHWTAGGASLIINFRAALMAERDR